MSEGFKIGDVVQLKSGGADMTTTAFSVMPGSGGEITLIHTAWFDGGHLRMDAFPEICLRRSNCTLELKIDTTDFTDRLDSMFGELVEGPDLVTAERFEEFAVAVMTRLDRADDSRAA